MGESDRRQLGCITDKQQFTLFTAENILKKIIQKVSGRKKAEIGQGRILDHRSLIDDKKRLLMKVLLEFQRDHTILCGPCKVDLAVNGIRLLPGIPGKDLGSPAGWCQQDRTFFNLRKDL